MTEIAVGSVVQLKSGGPQMTVSEVDGAKVRVQWFEGTQLNERVVTVDSLVKREILFG